LGRRKRRNNPSASEDDWRPSAKLGIFFGKIRAAHQGLCDPVRRSGDRRVHETRLDRHHRESQALAADVRSSGCDLTKEYAAINGHSRVRLVLVVAAALIDADGRTGAAYAKVEGQGARG
jgi:hypothetical protein